MRRIISYFIITLLLFMTVAPCFGHKYFNAYAEETTEQLTDDQKLEAGLSVYLNSRNGFITGPVNQVKSLMLSLIKTEEFWENTTVGSIAEVYASIIIKYSPFRVSLKGSAVRAFNDLYNYLKDNDMIPNAADSDGGETTDNLYNGAEFSGSLFYKFTTTRQPYSMNVFVKSSNDVKRGYTTNAVSGNEILQHYLTQKNITKEQFDSTKSNSELGLQQGVSYTFNYFTNITYNFNTIFRTQRNVYPAYGNILKNGDGWQIFPNDKGMFNCLFYSQLMPITSNNCYMLITYGNVAYYAYGWVAYNRQTDEYGFSIFGLVNRNDQPNINDSNINLDTDDFQKQDPPVPEGDDEVEYTPKDKDTGNTYNTYNEYINNYVIKKTVINKEEVTPPPGGTVPDWGDSGSGSGTITPGEGNTYNFNLPDFELPDLNIDWNISGLGEKFPFSIPFDLIAFFTVLNAEPETPAVQGQIDLKIVQWDIDWDLSQFDSLARILRNLEFIGFCIALILITRRIIKG